MSARNARTIEVPIEWFDPLVLSDIPTVVQVNTEAAISELVVTLDRYRPGYAVIFIDIQGTQYGIVLEGAHDIQLMELATRSLCRGYVSGLATCIARDDTIPAEDVLRWINMGGGQFSADFNSAFEDFKQRPFSNGTRRHCPQKFKLLVRLYDHYSSELTPEWKARMVSATKDRVRQSQSAGVDDHEIDMGRAPDGWHEIEDCPGESANFYPGRVGR
ncbi:hypothetical protein BKA59DRAFT_449943 [Fusarium tricinctum]|uniref:Uncharacterized protein n=1 Tax=Fusarium tricinctum TaxID=61284 RepID=A0A8K0S768_9HYPO|nr:hypothetical protein BKA59DRAFT_449943 [Fusarium tricinctum]